MRQILGALLGCGWTVDQVLELSFPQMSEVARCVYAHKTQMISSVLDPIIGGLNEGSKSGKRRGLTRRSSSGPTTQADLRQSGLSPAERDRILISRINALGFNVG